MPLVNRIRQGRDWVVDRYCDWKTRPRPITHETILQAAERGGLYALFEPHYNMAEACHCPVWQSYIGLCKELKEEGFLKATIEEYCGKPFAVNWDATITIAGRRYLRELRKARFERLTNIVGLAQSLFGWIGRVVALGKPA
jgi:hypothetical protein